MRVLVVVMVIWLFMAAPVAHAQTPTPEPGHGLPIPEVPNLKETFNIPDAIGLDPDYPRQVIFWWDIDNLLNFLYASAASLWFIVNRTFYLWYAVLTFGLIMLAFRFFFRVRSGDMEIEGLGHEPLDNYVVPTEDEKWLM